MAAMQISNEIERIGDLAISIIKRAKSIKDKHHLMAKFDVADIAKEVEFITAKTNACFLMRSESAIGEVALLIIQYKTKVMMLYMVLLKK